MKILNVHLITVLTGLAALYYYQKHFTSETIVCFGFAENRELQIRENDPVRILKIFKKSGTLVKKGDTLLVVAKAEINLNQGEIKNQIAGLQSQHLLYKSGLQASINRLEATKQVKINEIQNEINLIKSKITLNKSILHDLNSIADATTSNQLSPSELKINNLKKL